MMLTLSGWTQPSDAVARALAPDAATFDYSDYATLEASFEGLRAFADAEAIIAWSLGGQVALRAIAAGVLRPKRLTLIATPYQFVQSATRKHAMDAQTFQTFRDNYAQDPKRTSARFHALVAKGDSQASHILKQLEHHPAVLDTQCWLPWLDMLGTSNLDGIDLRHMPPTTIIHGTRDAIVPIQQARLLAEMLPQAWLEEWDGAAHAPHLHDRERLQEALAA